MSCTASASCAGESVSVVAAFNSVSSWPELAVLLLERLLRRAVGSSDASALSPASSVAGFLATDASSVGAEPVSYTHLTLPTKA